MRDAGSLGTETEDRGPRTEDRVAGSEIRKAFPKTGRYVGWVRRVMCPRFGFGGGPSTARALLSMESRT
jgi:hypothetical protein